MAKDNRKRILFVISSLTGGGAERVLSNILKGIDRQRFIPSLALFEKKGVYLEQVPGDVKIYDLKKKNRFDFLRLIFALAYNVYSENKPDVVVSFNWYASQIALVAKMIFFVHKPAVVISQRNHPSLSIKKARVRALKAWLLKRLYPCADAIIAVSEGIKRDLRDCFKVPVDKIKVVYNGVDIPLVESLGGQLVENFFKEGTPVVISCGRLTHQKNYPLLLKAFSGVVKENNAKLLILGDGEERKNLKSLAYELGMQENVEFLGFKNNPFKYMAKADIFVLSSLFEGFSNVILEAMACGVAVISTCCPSGADEIITDGVNGLLVPVGDAGALAKAILRLLKDESLRRRLAGAGRRRVEDFRVGKMVSEYENVLDSVTGWYNQQSEGVFL